MKKLFLPTHLKQSNRRIIYDTIVCCGVFSRASLSRKSGISSPTIIKIIDFFLEKGIVVEADGDQPSAQVGRTPTMLRFNPEFAYCLGVYLDGVTLSAGILDMCGGVIFVQHRPMAGLDLLEILRQMPELAETCIQQSGIDRHSLLGMGLGLPGVLDIHTAIMDFAPLVGVRRQTDLKPVIQSLKDAFQMPVIIENDVNAAAWGEYCLRYAVSRQDMVYLNLGAGLGAGIVLNGQLLRGRSNMAGEVGYLCCDPEYIARLDGPGWLESRINLSALTGQYGQDIVNGTVDLPTDKKAAMISQVASCLSLAIANINAIVGTELFVLDGQIPRMLGSPLFSAIQSRLDRLCISPIQLIPSRYGESGLQGLGFLVSADQMSALLRDDARS